MGTPAYLINLIDDDIELIEATSEDSAYPIENLYDLEIPKVFRAQSPTAVTITINFGSIMAICDTIALINHNFSPYVDITLKNGDDSPMSTIGKMAYRQYDMWYSFPQEEIGEWVLQILDSNTENIQIGQLLLGLRVDLPRQRRIGGFIPGRNRGVISSETYGGVQKNYLLFDRKTFNPVFRVIGSSELNIMDTLDQEVDGNVYPFLYIPDDELAACHYVRKQVDYGPVEVEGSHPDNLVYDYQLQLVEEPRGLQISS